MIILRNTESLKRIPYSQVVGSHTYKGRGIKVAVVALEDGREFPLEYGEIIKIDDEEWEVYKF